MDPLVALLVITGVGTVALGAVHLVIPHLVDIRVAVPPEGPPLRPLPLIGRHYATRRQDVHGVIWVSNNAASYVLLSLGIADLVAPLWLGTEAGRILALWVAGWWAVRAASQIAFGRRAIDLTLVGIFGGVAALHLAAALA